MKVRIVTEATAVAESDKDVEGSEPSETKF
jgi:hypothetical protein